MMRVEKRLGVALAVVATLAALVRPTARHWWSTAEHDERSQDQAVAIREMTARQTGSSRRPLPPPRFITPRTAAAFPGFPVDTPASPDLLFDRETRDPTWAPAMESALANGFVASATLARLGLAELVVTDITCRQTTCRFEYEFPSRLVNLARATGLRQSSPMVLVEEAVGWAAPRGAGLHRIAFQRDGAAFTRMSVVLGFDEASWDPANYSQWLQSQRPAAEAFYRRAREEQAKELSDGAGRIGGNGFEDAG
jgi:type II secretory pathway pseudopilin PulG